jgi:P27 family predicted phage terminase small subunit
VAGQRQPIELIIANGRKNLTKAEIEYRKNTEVKAPVGDCSPPDYLPAKLKEEFESIADKLISIGIMTELDVDLLARYLLSKQAYLGLTSRYMKMLSSGNPADLEKIANLQDKSFKQCQSAARDLGLTISSRCKLVVPKVDDEPKENKFARFQKGVG